MIGTLTEIILLIDRLTSAKKNAAKVTKSPFWRLREGSRASREGPGGSREAPGRIPGGSREAPGGSESLGESLDSSG